MQKKVATLHSGGARRFFAYVTAALVFGFSFLPVASAATQGATLYVGPSSGSFTVGSTFTVTFYVNTGNQFINVVDANILFPADKLQVVSPSTGASFINVWAIQPSYSNTEGTMSFRGAVPSPGVNTSAGLISTVTFRVKAVGTATIRFANGSKVLLNDGLGTDILQQMQSGIYTFALPPPSGPVVSSSTHPDQSRWYSGRSASLSWAGDAGANGYSYMLSDEPVDIPSNIVTGTKTGTTYKDLENGRHYFHIKALRDGVWGGTTHYALNVDNEPPAEFPIAFIPSSRTAQHQPVIKFFTTDADSGLDHYEIKTLALSVPGEESQVAPGAKQEVPLYIEAESPYIPAYLNFGRYDIFVRAYDAAGNYRETTQRLEIVPTLFEIVQGQGIEFKNVIFIPWAVFWGFGLLLLIVLGLVGRRMHWWHRQVDETRKSGTLPEDVSSKLKQLKEYQQKYGKIAVFLLMIIIASTALIGGSVQAQSGAPINGNAVLSPPVITTISKDIFNDEIFYVGGRTSDPDVDVLLYVQRLDDGQTTSHRITSDEKANWFYRHTTFLQSGGYLIWAQAQRDEELSPPSPQVTMTVASHAIQMGTSRFSYEAIYFTAMMLLAIIVLILAFAIWYHYHHGKRKRAKFTEEKGKIEESIRRGFALLHRDIEDELGLLRHSKQSKELNDQERQREEQLLKDLEQVKQHMGEEIWELEKIEEGY